MVFLGKVPSDTLHFNPKTGKDHFETSINLFILSNIPYDINQDISCQFTYLKSMKLISVSISDNYGDFSFCQPSWTPSWIVTL